MKSATQLDDTGQQRCEKFLCSVLSLASVAYCDWDDGVNFEAARVQRRQRVGRDKRVAPR